MATIEHNGYTIVDGVLQLDDLRVEGSLNLIGCTDLTALPEGLSVGGWLDLNGCTALTALPDGLSVGRSLFLNGCTALTALPDDLSVGECLYLNDCTALTALPNGLSVEGSIDLEGCTALTAIPDDLGVGRSIFLSKIWLSSNEAILRKVSLPESIRTAAIGRRLGDLVDHWALSWNGMRDQMIESIEDDGDGDIVIRLQPHASDA